jgi:cell division protein FtsI (penicillin-binding protein 3)
MASQPSYNPGAGHAVGFNQVTKGVYELGSIFKSFAVAQGLELGVTSEGERHDATKPMRVAGFSISDYHAQNRMMTTTDVFIHSSNIGTARIIDEVGPERQREFLGKLGLLEAPVIELPETSRPLLPKIWGRLASMTVAYGHGIAATPLQMAGGLAALVNGGYRITPHLVDDRSRILSRDQVLSKATSDRMRKLLRLAVKQGTGGASDVEGYRVGGKTGTADKVSGRGYASNARISTFAAVFPMDAPRYVVMVSIDEPRKGAVTGGGTAAPLVRNIILRAAPALGVARSDEDLPVDDLMQFVAKPKPERRRQ